MKNLYTWVAAFLFVALAISVMACTSASSAGTVTVVDRPDIHAVNTNYMGYRAPLRPFMGHRTKRFFQWSGKMGERF